MPIFASARFEKNPTKYCSCPHHQKFDTYMMSRKVGKARARHGLVSGCS
jgi:hypothetical protein